MARASTTRVPTRKVSGESVSAVLVYYGFSKNIAGDALFAKSVDAVQKMFATGRGLLLSGPAGCGKTKLMSTVMKSLKDIDVSFYYCKEPRDMEYLRNNADDTLNGNVYLDDIGSEERLREYGNTIDIVGDFIQRYHYRGKGRLFATTNLTPLELQERYDGRILDRLLEMCVLVKMEGKSKRERIII